MLSFLRVSVSFLHISSPPYNGFPTDGTDEIVLLKPSPAEGAEFVTVLPRRTVYALEHIRIVHDVADIAPAFLTMIEVLPTLGFPGNPKFFLSGICPDRFSGAENGTGQLTEKAKAIPIAIWDNLVRSCLLTSHSSPPFLQRIANVFFPFGEKIR